MYSNDHWQNSTSCHFSLGEVELEVKFLQIYYAKHFANGNRTEFKSNFGL